MMRACTHAGSSKDGSPANCSRWYASSVAAPVSRVSSQAEEFYYTLNPGSCRPLPRLPGTHPNSCARQQLRPSEVLGLFPLEF